MKPNNPFIAMKVKYHISTKGRDILLNVGFSEKEIDGSFVVSDPLPDSDDWYLLDENGLLGLPDAKSG